VFLKEMGARYEELCLLNTYIKATLPFMMAGCVKKDNGTASRGRSSLSALFSSARHVMLSAITEPLWNRGLGATKPSGSLQKFDLVLRRSLDYDTDPDQLVEHKHTFFGQAFEKLHPMPTERLRHTGQLWNAIMAGFRAHDAGGPYRESFALFCSDIQSGKLPLLLQSPNNLQNVATDRGSWLPNPAATSRLQLQMFQFLGKLMGIAIRNKEYLPLSLAPIVWAKLVGSPVTTGVLQRSHYSLVQAAAKVVGYHIETPAAEAVSGGAASESATLPPPPSLQRIVSRGGSSSGGLTPENFKDALCLTFEHVGLDGKTYELFPGGEDVEVGFEDRARYAALRLNFAMQEFDKQIDAIRAGLAEIVPTRILFTLRWDTLCTLTCGIPEVDLQLLKDATVYKRWSAGSPAVKAFWGAMERMSNAERSQFLRFVWGRSRLPLTLEEFGSKKFTIQGVDKGDETFPIAHTCFFSLDLPNYSSVEVAYEKLVYAAFNTAAIDGDGTGTASTTQQMGFGFGSS